MNTRPPPQSRPSYSGKIWITSLSNSWDVSWDSGTFFIPHSSACVHSYPVGLNSRVLVLAIITPDKWQSKTFILSTNVRNRWKQSFRLSFVARLATNGNQKHCFKQLLIRVRRLQISFPPDCRISGVIIVCSNNKWSGESVCLCDSNLFI